MLENSLPLLIFPSPEPVALPKGSGGGKLPSKPTIGKKGRFERNISTLKGAFNSLSNTINDPTRTLVLETIGRIQDFHKAAATIEGLEWQGELDVEQIEEARLEAMYEKDSKEFKGARKAKGRHYFTSSNLQALDKLLELYKIWQQTGTVKRGLGPWETVFTYISDMRLWNEQDRLESTGVLQRWREDLEVNQGSDSKITFEIELHFYRDDSTAEKNEKACKDELYEHEATIENIYRNSEIGFHALKVTLPVDSVARVLHAYDNGTKYPQWIQFNGIKYCRPIGQQQISDFESEGEGHSEVEQPSDDPPVVALLDGLPAVQHELLKHYLVLDDPDNFADKYEPKQREHGTFMASLICHNDLNHPEKQSVRRKIYVRPIMYPQDAIHDREQIPAGEFVEDIVERSVVRMFDIQGGEPAVCPTVKIINLSIGDLSRPFLREMSAWAKLLDWLSWKYKVLFIISAGNADSPAGFGSQRGWSKEFVEAISKQQIDRRLLSPVESMNGLTVGAMQLDYSTPADSLLPEVWQLPATYNRLGAGFRNQIKPDILVEGGQQAHQVDKNNGKVEERQDLGQKAASVRRLPESIQLTTHSIDTSNATALATHAAAHLYEVLDQLQKDQSIEDHYHALILKSLLVHGAGWLDMPDGLLALFTKAGGHKKRQWAKFWGYGKANFERVMSCTEQRVTLIGYGALLEKERHRFKLWIPQNCHGMYLRLTVTLAWFTPINPRRWGYRQAKLAVAIEGDDNKKKYKRENADWQQVKNGTIQHEIFHAANFSDEELQLFVTCRPNAMENLDESIPYAISLTVEAAGQTAIDLYSQIRDAIPIPTALPAA